MGPDPEVPSEVPENPNKTWEDEFFAKTGMPRPTVRERNKSVPGEKTISNVKNEELCEQFALDLQHSGIHKILLDKQENTIQKVWGPMYTKAFFGYHDANGNHVEGYMSSYKDWAKNGVYNFRKLVGCAMKHYAKEYDGSLASTMPPSVVETLCKPIWQQWQRAVDSAKALAAAKIEQEAKEKRENEAMEKYQGLRPSERPTKKKKHAKSPCLLLAGNPKSPAGKLHEFVFLFLSII